MNSAFGIQKTVTTVAPLTTNPTNTTTMGFGSFGSAANTAVSSSGGFSFGSPSTGASTFNTTQTGGFGFGSTTTAGVTPTGGFGFGSTTSTVAQTGSTTTASTGFSLPTSTSSSFGVLGSTFGQQTTTTAPSFGLGLFSSTTTTSSLTGSSTTSTGFSVGITSTSTTTGFTVGAPTATTSTTGFSLGITAITTSTGFTLGIPSTSTATGFSLDKSLNQSFSSTATTTTSSLPGLATTANTSNLVATSSPTLKNTAAQVKFSQLEENINKWTIELEEQEKIFMNQVAHINEWDRLLLSNGDKIVNLNNSVEKLKLEQQQLDHELDFIVAQQRELEECLLPLEKEFKDINISDPERDATYRLAENLNTQLRHMSEDLKEIIEDINEKNKNQDTTDPIVQIGRILNAHMNSLQWVDQNTTLIKQQLDQVTKLTEIHRRENDSTQNL